MKIIIFFSYFWTWSSNVLPCAYLSYSAFMAVFQVHRIRKFLGHPDLVVLLPLYGSESESCHQPVLRIRIRIMIWIDPQVFGPPESGSRSSSQRYGSGSFYHQAKLKRKTLIPAVLWLLFDFNLWKMMKNYVNIPSYAFEITPKFNKIDGNTEFICIRWVMVPTKSNKQKNLVIFFCRRLEG